MHLENIRLLNFKNYEEVDLSFSSRFNCITGLNGSGKTNLLDSIYFLCLTKSAFNNNDTQLIRHKQQQSFVSGTYIKSKKKYLVSSGIQIGKKKIFKINKQEHDRMADHIGLFPCVMIAPNDTDLIREGSEIRRKFFDSILCQTDHKYLEHLLSYTTILKQRNSFLKQCAENRQFDPIQLEAYNTQLIKFGQYLFIKRQALIEEFTPVFNEIYNQLSNDKEQVSLVYKSDMLEDNLATLFDESQAKDLVLQRTTCGCHKDDYVFKLHDKTLKKYGSQGQQKSYVISLKLAQLTFIEEQMKTTPILLLDDIFDKLDDFRIQNLLTIINKNPHQQIFISDARAERTTEILKDKIEDVSFFEINSGKLVVNG